MALSGFYHDGFPTNNQCHVVCATFLVRRFMRPNHLAYHPPPQQKYLSFLPIKQLYPFDIQLKILVNL
jgi:hypothetical protein